MDTSWHRQASLSTARDSWLTTARSFCARRSSLNRDLTPFLNDPPGLTVVSMANTSDLSGVGFDKAVNWCFAVVRKPGSW